MKNLKNRLSKARGAFHKLKIWISYNILRKTNLRLYKTLVVPVLLYGSETWKMNKEDDKAVHVFHNRCLRKILRIRWQDHVSTKELLERAGMKPLSVEVMSRRWLAIFLGKIAMMTAMLLWAGHQKVKGEGEDRGETYSRKRKARGRLELVRGGVGRSKQSSVVEKSGGKALSRPYVPWSTMRIGEGEGEGI